MMRRIALSLVAAFALGAMAVAQQQPIGNGLPGAIPGSSTSATPPSGGLNTATGTRTRRENPVTSIQEFVRVDGYARAPLRGIGIVMGLPGTGDTGAELVLARPLASIYAANGNPLPDLRELAKARSAAIVMISCVVPEGGGRFGDTFDIIVSAMHSAKSLRGGTLIISPLMNPDTKSPVVFAMAQGQIVLEDPEVPTSGKIGAGAQLIKDIRPPAVGARGSGTFDLILRPHFRSFQVARTLAAEINGITADLENEQDSTDPVAQAIDDTTIRVMIPEHERANPTNFLARIMSKRFSPSLIDLPAMVVVNEKTGSIVVTGDVEISAVTVGSDRLIVTTTTPTPTPTAANPLVTQQNWTEFGSTATGGERARIQDLLEAFKHLNVPVREQIQILSQIDRAGRLNARFIRE